MSARRQLTFIPQAEPNILSDRDSETELSESTATDVEDLDIGGLTISERQDVSERQDGDEWLSDHPWKDRTPNYSLKMKETVANSASYPTSRNWTRPNGDVDLAKICSNLPKFIESEMKGTINSSHELEKLVSHVIRTQKQLMPKESSDILPNMAEIVDKLQGKNSKDQGSYKDEEFTCKASSIPKSTTLVVSPGAENYFHFDCEFILKMYVPDSMLSWFDTQPVTKWIRKIKNTEKRWIFIPSFRRAQIALLKWPQDDIVTEESTIRILVVRPSEFDEYVKHCSGHRFPVICLPQDEIGAGYARYWIQKIAVRLMLKFIWMIDDSIECFYEYHPDKAPPTPGSYKEHRRRKFGCVFKRIEEFVKEADDSEPIAAMSPRRFNGLFGLQIKDPFVCKPPQVAVYLNLEALSTKNISYRPELKTLEDMIFGYECEKNGLKVFMDNRVHLQDHINWKNTGASSPSVKIKKT